MPYKPDAARAARIEPVEPKPGATPRQGTGSQRSFADLLAEAEAVRDHVQVSRQAARGGAPAAGGLWQSAVGVLLMRQAPGSASGTGAGTVAGSADGKEGRHRRGLTQGD